MGVYHGSPYVAVAEKGLNCAYVIVGLQKMRGKRMAEGVRRDAR